MLEDFYNYDSMTCIYRLRLAGIYYRRVGEAGWQVIPPEQVQDLEGWSPVHPTQWEVIVDELITQGLLTGAEWWLLFRRQQNW